MSGIIATLLGIASLLFGIFVPMRYPNLPEWISDGGILLGILLMSVAGGLYISDLPIADKLSRNGIPKISILLGITIGVFGAVLLWRIPNEPDGANVSIHFVHPKSPSIQLVNESGHVARDIKWAVVIWNKRLFPERIDPLPIPIQTFDWIKGRQSGGPQSLFLDTRIASLIKDGDELIGTASVNCPECTSGKTYVVFIKFGVGGWYSEIKTETSGDVIVPHKMTEESIRAYFDNIQQLAPQDARIPIKDG